MRTTFLALISGALLSAPALADELILTPTEMSFEDAAFAVEAAIVGRGLVIDYTSHVGEMLERTRADIGSDVVLFTNANIYMFCSASTSRRAMEADWQNVAYCPYGIQVIERPGEPVTLSYMHRDTASMSPVNDLLAAIVDEANF